MSDTDTYEIPLQDQRVFGAGIKRKRVQFVPSTAPSSNAPTTSPTSAKSISDLYLSLVLPKQVSSTDTETSTQTTPSIPLPPTASPNLLQSSIIKPSEPAVCEICKLPISSANAPDPAVSEDSLLPEPSDPSNKYPTSKPRPHEASLAHQVCLTHSHPPSHLDRRRKGLAYLSAYGWDPDSRLGLGAEGQGIQFPIKTKPKDDKLGIGVVVPPEGQIWKTQKVKKLDAGKVRKLQERDRRKGERLREMFYRSEDVERYLGGG